MKRPALGHVLGYTALTVMLTAGAAQSLTGSSTVFTDDIADAHVRVADIGAGAVGSSEIIDNSIRSADVGNDLITGTDINEDSLIPTCASGLTAVADVCYSAPRVAATFEGALTICIGEDLRLPSISEARAVAVATDDANFLWTDVAYSEGATPNAIGVNKNSALAIINRGVPTPYRCVTSIGARP